MTDEQLRQAAAFRLALRTEPRPGESFRDQVAAASEQLAPSIAEQCAEARTEMRRLWAEEDAEYTTAENQVPFRPMTVEQIVEIRRMMEEASGDRAALFMGLCRDMARLGCLTPPPAFDWLANFHIPPPRTGDADRTVPQPDDGGPPPKPLAPLAEWMRDSVDPLLEGK